MVTTKRATNRNFYYHTKNKSLCNNPKDSFFLSIRGKLPHCLAPNLSLINQEKQAKGNDCSDSEANSNVNELIKNLIRNAHKKLKAKLNNECAMEQENDKHPKIVKKRVRVARKLTDSKNVIRPTHTTKNEEKSIHLPITKATLYYGVTKSGSSSKRLDQEEATKASNIYLPNEYAIPQFRIVIKRNIQCNRSFM